MPSKAVVLVVASFLLVVLIFSLYSIPAVFARIDRGPISCAERMQSYMLLCCQTETDSTTGISINWCTWCDNTDPPSNCGPRFSLHSGLVNGTAAPTPAGNVLPPSNGTGTLPLEA